MIFSTKYASPIGPLILASEGERLAGLWMEGQKYFASTVKEEMIEKKNLPVFSEIRDWLDKYFAGEKPGLSHLPLAPAGSAFRQQIWKLLCEIPYGETTTYKEISIQMAAIMGRKSMSSQAVGGAVGHNPISIIIPCHRVLGSDGSLTGYAGGVEKKIKLLQLEGAIFSF
jgi:methylated-DNA-[protein]-cysteine S-methyltransferase